MRTTELTLKDRMRHVFNPLHVYCSLSWVLRKRTAILTARLYEKSIYSHLFAEE
ncbi:MAG: hypothetical protein HY751_12585 [Nitrospinae bacterium]|nr:hypothetical protein [Nitrospinota bacterium]